MHRRLELCLVIDFGTAMLNTFEYEVNEKLS